MNFKIIVDSCCDLTPEYKANEHFAIVPLTLMVDDYEIIDDETFDQADFLAKVAASRNCPKSACPSPERYMEEYKKIDGDIYVVTLSAELSGSYNSARVAAEMYAEQGGKNNVYIVNSRSAASGEVLIALKLYEQAMAGMNFEDMKVMIEEFTDDMSTFFVLESLETLRKNGRLSTMQAIIAKTLNIKPVMKATPIGTIEKVEQLRGFSKAVSRMIEIIAVEVKNQENKTAAIAHCNNYDGALKAKETMEKLCKFKDIIIVDTAGVSSMYANDGGIIICS